MPQRASRQAHFCLPVPVHETIHVVVSQICCERLENYYREYPIRDIGHRFLGPAIKWHGYLDKQEFPKYLSRLRRREEWLPKELRPLWHRLLRLRISS